MALNGQIDVVVIGFGVAGAAAALAGVDAGARVLVLESTGAPTGRGWKASRRARERAALRDAAREAGVEVRRFSRAHELVMEGDRVRGVGYAALPDGGTAAVTRRILVGLSDAAPRRAARAVARGLDRLAPSDFQVGEVACAAVVLAIHPRHWDFVGPGVWTATRWAAGSAMAAGRPAHLYLVRPEEAGESPSPELNARLWCAPRTSGPTAEQRREVCTDEATGAVHVGDDIVVRGLYAAVPQQGFESTECAYDAMRAAGRRAGRQAAGMTAETLPRTHRGQGRRALTAGG
jgi:hypothetical protein